MSKTTNNDTPFMAELKRNILATIRSMKMAGTTGASMACLRQCTPTPRACQGAPVGTNAQWVYAELFNEACADMGIHSFILD